MGLRDEYDFDQLVNDTERYVIDALERLLRETEGPLCTCQDCVLDMAAFALNSIKPMYHVSLLGKLYSESPESAMAEMVDTAVRASINRVRSNPSHD